MNHDRIAVVGDALDSLVPRRAETPDWQDVLTRSRRLQGGGRGRRLAARVLAVSAAAGVLVALLLAAPWQGRGPTVVERALAAVGGGPVVHAVVEYSSPDDVLVEIDSGKERERVRRTEYWYDAERKELHTRLLVDGVQITEMVEKPTGLYSDLGRYPGSGGYAPQLDPALAGFATGYRDALDSGRARFAGDTTVAGRPAKRILIRLDRGVREQVIVDAATFKPLSFSRIEAPSRVTFGIFDPRTGAIRTWFTKQAGQAHHREWRVVSIESVPRDPSFFEPPKLSPPRPTAGGPAGGEEIAVADAHAAIGREPLWLGPAFGGRTLDSVRVERYHAEWTNGRRGGGTMLVLSYGNVTVSQTADPAAAYQLGFDDGGDPPPPPGFLAADGGQASLRAGGLWLGLEAPNRAMLLRAARALTPLE